MDDVIQQNNILKENKMQVDMEQYRVHIVVSVGNAS